MTAIQQKKTPSVAGPVTVGPGKTEARRRSAPGRAVLRLALLTGGGDKPYVLGITEALTGSGISVDVIGSDNLVCRELTDNPEVNFLNLRGDLSHDAGRVDKTIRVLRYYVRLLKYAATTQSGIFHILWNNKFELFDRTLLMIYYRAFGKRVVMTAHNVNAAARDGGDSFLNRTTLKVQYSLCHHIFVHTEKMKGELIANFDVADDKISVIPFGINNTAPNTGLTTDAAKSKLGLSDRERTMLFFGRIVPYKGLEYLIEALARLVPRCPGVRLIIAGAITEAPQYWQEIQQAIIRTGTDERIIQKIQFIPDEETELYFKAADVLVLPYNHIFQTGVLFLAYSFGLPSIVSDVGSLKEEIVEGKTGFVVPPKNPAALAEVIEKYFSSDLFKNLESQRPEIREYANERYSWSKVAAITTGIYSKLLKTNASTPAAVACNPDPVIVKKA
ncbi:MAG TPA: glycosyltransferase family 4 protein [Verrucomicrobiae bacterium]|jgi:glycosyltransferase involved in cell wall biosynthesis